MTDIFRRRLLQFAALATLSPPGSLLAGHNATERIIALEWLPMEMLFILGVVPVGVTDPENYMTFVQEPPVPHESNNIGLRTEPNLELITELDPSLIVYSAGYGPSPDMLRTIAPVFPVEFNNGTSAPLATTRRSLTALASRIGREQQASAHIENLGKQLEQTRNAFAHYDNRPLLLMSFVDELHALIFGKGSLFQDVLAEIAIPNAWTGDTNFWGGSLVGIERLSEFQHVNVICFMDNDEAIWRNLSVSPVWKSMPFVESGHFTRVPMLWFYGGTLTAMRFSKVLENVLKPT